ncbi:MAG: hypothetical protein R3B46_11090 [Phycisphaerales bacterium]
MRKHELNFGSAWDYAPAPESVKVQIDASYSHFINGEFTKTGRAAIHFTIAPPTNRNSQKSRWAPPRMSTAARRRRVRSTTQVARKLPAKERGKFLYRLARQIQERAPNS